LVSALGEGAESTLRARIALRLKLVRSCSFDTMMGKFIRKTGTERDGGAAQGSLLLASPQQGVLPSRNIQQGTGVSQPHFRQPLAGLVLKSY
jgi:hypothetical protein